MEERASVIVDMSEVDETLELFRRARSHAARVPMHLVQKLEAIGKIEPEKMIHQDRVGGVVTLGLAPEVRALVANLRALEL